MPHGGFSRWKGRIPALPEEQTAYRSHDGLLVVSSLVNAELPGSGEPPLVGPTWHVSVSLSGRGRERPNDEQIRRVVEAFAMPAFDEDNHHPGLARHLFCPLEEQYREACECKAREVVITEPDGYRWTTEEGDCRGCWYQQRFGLPCTIHGAP
jgi:hypothetical protein